MPLREASRTSSGAQGTLALRVRPNDRISFSVSGTWTGQAALQIRPVGAANWEEVTTTTVNVEGSIISPEHADYRGLTGVSTGSQTLRIGRG